MPFGMGRQRPVSGLRLLIDDDVGVPDDVQSARQESPNQQSFLNISLARTSDLEQPLDLNLFRLT